MVHPFQRLLIANRGEIAARIIRTAKKMGITTIAIYADPDSSSWYTTLADEAYPLGQGSLSETYLNIDKIISIARRVKADAIHPGYGFLSENPAFAKACETAAINFIGPVSDVIQLMGNKTRAKEIAEKAGLPVLQSYYGTPDQLAGLKDKLDYPILIKPAAGGGGKGMHLVREPEQFQEALISASREAQAYFNDESVFVEKFLENPRHIEVQILADHFGNVLHLFERECSLQRRYQKIIEEAPSPSLDLKMRDYITTLSVNLAKEVEYTNAGTIEFIMDHSGKLFFLEMNTRIQVEHPVTEEITGIDIVQKQIEISEGHPLLLKQEDITYEGHAIECRIYAENAEDGFMPSPGKMSLYIPPQTGRFRLDAAQQEKTEIFSFYDPLIGKLITKGNNRNEAIDFMYTALSHYKIHGIVTNIAFLKQLVLSKKFQNNSISTTYIEQHLAGIQAGIDKNKKGTGKDIVLLCGLSASTLFPKKTGDVWNFIGYWRILPVIPVELEKEKHEIFLSEITKDSYRASFNKKEYHVEIKKIEDYLLHVMINKVPYTVIFSPKDARTFMIEMNDTQYLFRRLDWLDEDVIYSEGTHGTLHASDRLISPLHGKVIQVKAKKGQAVKKGEPLLIIESMKMENYIHSTVNGKIKEVHIKVGNQVKLHDVLITFEPVKI